MLQGKITHLEAQQRRVNRVNVYLDGRFAFSLDSSLAAGLQEGEDLAPERVEALLSEDRLNKARQRALHYLSYRPRSRQELRQYLRRKGDPPEVVERALEGLDDSGLVDDQAFARYWVENRERFRPRSALLLRQELRAKGLEEGAIQQVLAEVDEASSARRAARSQASRLAGLEEPEFRRKLGDYLRRRGFSYATVRDAVEELARQREHPEELSSEDDTSL